MKHNTAWMVTAMHWLAAAGKKILGQEDSGNVLASQFSCQNTAWMMAAMLGFAAVASAQVIDKPCGGV